MSKLLGSEFARWPLSRAIDALAESARLAGRPSLLWIGGFFYPGLGLSLGVGWSLIAETQSGARHMLAPDVPFGMPFEILAPNTLAGADPATRLFVSVLAFGACVAPMLYPFLIPLFRMIAGIATLVAGRSETPPGALRAAWRAGRGLGFATGGLWLQCWLLVIGAALVFLAPIVLFVKAVRIALETPGLPTPHTPLGYLLAGPSTLIVIAYAMVVSVLFQLALHSLAQNRRGVGSALVHAWRLARNDPWATARAVIVDAVLSLVFNAFWWAHLAVSGVPAIGWITLLAYVALGGFVGLTRASFWSRAYRGLGGLTPDDGVPGLERV